MKPSAPAEHVLCSILFVFLVLLVVAAPGSAQEVERKVPLVLPRQLPVKQVPVKPVQRPTPVRPQPQVQQRPIQPQRRVPPGGNQGTGELARGQRQPPLNQLPPGRGGNNPMAGRTTDPRMAGGRVAGSPGTGNLQATGFRMPPNARSVAMPAGGTMVVHPDGRRWALDKNNHVTAFSQNGVQAKFYENGRVNSIHVQRPGTNMMVARSLHGDRETFGVKPGGVVVVTYGRDRGWVQRPMPGRMGYFERTYMVGGQPYARVYRAYRYRGIVYVRPLSAYYYQPRFYQWAGGPWSSSATYGWQQMPGAGFYSSFFAPAQTYSSGSAWLTDYVLAANLQLAYQNRQEYQQQTGVPAPDQSNSESAAVSPEVKTAIAQEVQAEVSEEQAESTQSGGEAGAANGQVPPPALDPNQRTFVVSQSIDVPFASDTCSLTPGDVITRSQDNLLPGNKVAVTVAASKVGDCPVNTSTQIDLIMVQEFHNQFREQIDAGLGKLASNEGSGGLPAGPAANGRPAAEGTVQPDRDVMAALAQEQSDADGAEAAANNGASAVSGSASM